MLMESSKPKCTKTPLRMTAAERATVTPTVSASDINYAASQPNTIRFRSLLV